MNSWWQMSRLLVQVFQRWAHSGEVQLELLTQWYLLISSSGCWPWWKTILRPWSYLARALAAWCCEYKFLSVGPPRKASRCCPLPPCVEQHCHQPWLVRITTAHWILWKVHTREPCLWAWSAGRPHLDREQLSMGLLVCQGLARSSQLRYRGHLVLTLTSHLSNYQPHPRGARSEQTYIARRRPLTLLKVARLVLPPQSKEGDWLAHPLAMPLLHKMI